MTKNEINIKLLIEGCLKGNRNSQRKLYEHFYGYGMNITLRYAKRREEAVEILNDAFLKAFINIHKYDTSYAFKSWFRRILVNTAIDHHRKNHQIPVHLALTEGMELGKAEMEMPVLSPDEDVLPILQKLSPAYRIVFNLYVLEGYKHHEIAEMLNISVSSSRTNLFRAKSKLKSLLQKEGLKVKSS